MTSENSQQRVAWSTPFGNAPRHGSRVMRQDLNFALESTINLNLTFEQQQERIEFVQCLFVDNSANPAPLVFVFKGANQIVVFPAASQGYVPVMASMEDFKASVTTAFANADSAPVVTIFYLNFPLPAIIWNAARSSAGGALTSYNMANNPVALASLLATVPVNSGRSIIEVQNQSAAQIQVWIDDGAGGNITVILCDAGAGANFQGASWTSKTFKGRARVFATNATDQVAIYEI